MSSLWKRVVKDPRSYLGLVLLVVILVVVDASGPATEQVSGQVCVALIGFYQQYGRPLLAGHVVCRYEPTCSEYSKQAIQMYGAVRGVLFSVKRVASCTEDVPFNTEDPVSIARAD